MSGPRQKGMVFLEQEHPIIKDLVQSKLFDYQQADKDGVKAVEPIDVKVADFDGVVYHILAEKANPTKLKLSLQMRDFNTINEGGAANSIKSLYGSYFTSADAGYDMTLEIDAATTPEAQITKVANLMSLLKRNVIGAPLAVAFEALLSGGAGNLNPVLLKIREKEQIVVVPKGDRVLVGVSFDMYEKTDAALAVNILDFMARAAKTGNGPSAVYSKDVPNDLRKVNGVMGVSVGWMMFSITKANLANGNTENVINLLLSVRHYVHYHIKATKAHLHERMRAKVKSFLQVLNRAVPDKKGLVKKYRILDN